VNHYAASSRAEVSPLTFEDRSGGLSLLDWTGPDADARHADSLTVLLPTVIRLPGFQPPMGPLDALLGSGNLSLIETTPSAPHWQIYGSRT